MSIQISYVLATAPSVDITHTTSSYSHYDKGNKISITCHIPINLVYR